MNPSQSPLGSFTGRGGGDERDGSDVVGGAGDAVRWARALFVGAKGGRHAAGVIGAGEDGDGFAAGDGLGCDAPVRRPLRPVIRLVAASSHLASEPFSEGRHKSNRGSHFGEL